MGGEARKPQADKYFFVRPILKNHFGASGIVVAEVKYSPGGLIQKHQPR
jgi:hypothetical protein